jgi:glycyl-tRNA synthetase beta chain
MLDEAFVPHQASAAAKEAAAAFLWERDDFLHERRGARPDEVRAARPAGWADLDVIKPRVEAYKQARHLDKFKALAALFKRVKNITNAVADDGRELAAVRSLLVEPAELALADAMSERWPRLEAGVRDAKYGDVVQTLADLQPFVDRFFTDVLVMSPDVSLKEARLLLLLRLRRAVTESIGDISALATEDSKA